MEKGGSELITKKEAMEIMGIKNPYMLHVIMRFLGVSRKEERSWRGKVMQCLYDRSEIEMMAVKWEEIKEREI